MKIFSKILILLSFLHCRSLDEYSNKSNNPDLFKKIQGAWTAKRMMHYDGYKNAIESQEFASTFVFGGDGKFTDSNGLLGTYVLKQRNVPLNRLEWQIATDGNPYVTAYVVNEDKYADYRLWFYTRDQFVRAFKLEKMPTKTAAADTFLVFYNMQSCGSLDGMVLWVADGRGCVPSYLIAVVNKTL